MGARGLGDLAGSIISMWIVEELGANPHQLGELRGLLLGAAHLRGNVADVLGLDVKCAHMHQVQNAYIR